MLLNTKEAQSIDYTSKATMRISIIVGEQVHGYIQCFASLHDLQEYLRYQSDMYELTQEFSDSEDEIQASNVNYALFNELSKQVFKVEL